MINAIAEGKVLDHQMDLFVVVVMILVSMSLTLHVKTTNLACDAIDTLIRDQQRTITQLLSRANTRDSHAVISLHQTITVELVLSCVRQILSITGHTTHLSTILHQADSEWITTIGILIQIQSQSVHILHSGLLALCINLLLATNDSVINHAEDVIEHLVLQSLSHKGSQSCHTLPSIASYIHKAKISLDLLITPDGLNGLVVQVRLRHVAALSCIISLQSVLNSTTCLVIIKLTNITTLKHGVQQLIRCAIQLISHGAVNKLSNLLVGVTLVNQLLNMSANNLSNLLILGIHSAIVLSLLSNFINTTRLLHQLGHFNIQCHNSFPFSSRKIKELPPKTIALNFTYHIQDFFSQSSNSLCLGQHTDHNQLMAIVIHHTSKLKTRSTSSSNLPLTVGINLQQLADISVLCISSLVLVSTIQFASIQRNALHQHTCLNLGDHLIIVIKISLACIDALGNKLMGNHLDALSGSCIRELNLTSLVVNLNTHTGDHSDLCGIVSGNILRAVHHQFTNHNIFPFSQMLLLTQIFPPCVTLVSVSGVILGFIQIQLDTLRLMYLRSLNILFSRLCILSGFNTARSNHTIDASLIQILNHTCKFALTGQFSLSNHLAGNSILAQIFLFLCKLGLRLFCSCLLRLFLVRSQLRNLILSRLQLCIQACDSLVQLINLGVDLRNRNSQSNILRLTQRNFITLNSIREHNVIQLVHVAPLLAPDSVIFREHIGHVVIRANL
nr:MAG TPA: hypothetical protein [Bacteriophage sp.]